MVTAAMQIYLAQESFSKELPTLHIARRIALPRFGRSRMGTQGSVDGSAVLVRFVTEG
jgi:hypothetical protein